LAKRTRYFFFNARVVLAAGFLLLAALFPPRTAAAQPASPIKVGPSERQPKIAEREIWDRAILQTKRPSTGCFVATFPDTQWRPVACGVPPRKPYFPKHRDAIRTETVGGSGKDFVAEATGHITWARGSFDSVSGVTADSADSYSLQLNTDNLMTTACSGAPNSNCAGFEQFVYDSASGSGLIQYWLKNYGPQGSSCPMPRGANCQDGEVHTDGWCPQSSPDPADTDVYCAVNSPNAAVVGSQPLEALDQLRLRGEAPAGGAKDRVTVAVGGAAMSADGQNYFPDLGSKWQIAEFNVFGNCCGEQVTFNSGSTVVVRTSIDSGATTGPKCHGISFTAESNNLTLVATTETPSTSGLPSLIFTESNVPGSTEASCADAISIGDTHLTTFDGLHYDFQASGEFVLVEDSSGFVVQTRQASGAPAWPDAAINKAVATKMSGARVAIYIEPIRLVINDETKTLADGVAIVLPSGVQVARRGNQYVISDDGGDSVRATLNTTWIDVAVGLGHGPPESVRGLLASTGGKANALVTSTGSILSQPISFGDLYHTYANSWRVRRGQSLFADSSSINAGIPSKPFFASQLNHAVYERALAVCKAAGVRNKDLIDDCVLDSAVLNDRTAAGAFVHGARPRLAIKPVAPVRQIRARR
jgi:hypothetical protein